MKRGPSVKNEKGRTLCAPIRFVRSKPLVEFVNDGAIFRIHEIHVVVRVNVAILGHRRTPVRRNRAEFDISREPRSDADSFLRRDGRDPFLHDVFLDPSALLRCEADAGTYRPDLDADTVCTENLNPDILVMKSAQDRT